MAADEIFVLVLIVLIVGSVAVMEIRSRRKQIAAAESEPTIAEETGAMATPPVEAAPSKTNHQQKRRRH